MVILHLNMFNPVEYFSRFNDFKWPLFTCTWINEFNFQQVVFDFMFHRREKCSLDQSLAGNP